MNLIKNLLSSSIINAFRLWLKILKMMVPISIIVKIMEAFGLVTLLGKALTPVMVLVGLPGIMGLVWGITLVTNLWAGALLFVTLAISIKLTTAQVTVLGILMLMAHGLPIEIRMVQKCGVRAIFALILRLGSAISLALLFHCLFSSFHWMQSPAHILMGTSDAASNTLSSWALNQVQSYFFVLCMLLGMVSFLDILKHFNLVGKLGVIFAPYLSLIGVSKKCAPITLVGMTLGLVYGGVLLLKEIEVSELDPNDVLLSVTSMNLFHSIIEDSTIIFLMGGSLFWVLPIRFVFALLVMQVITFLLRNGKLSYQLIKTFKHARIENTT